MKISQGYSNYWTSGLQEGILGFSEKKKKNHMHFLTISFQFIFSARTGICSVKKQGEFKSTPPTLLARKMQKGMETSLHKLQSFRLKINTQQLRGTFLFPPSITLISPAITGPTYKRNSTQPINLLSTEVISLTQGRK